MQLNVDSEMKPLQLLFFRLRKTQFYSYTISNRENCLIFGPEMAETLSLTPASPPHPQLHSAQWFDKPWVKLNPFIQTAPPNIRKRNEIFAKNVSKRGQNATNMVRTQTFSHLHHYSLSEEERGGWKHAEVNHLQGDPHYSVGCCSRIWFVVLDSWSFIR